jgi:hypothetical protein
MGHTPLGHAVDINGLVSCHFMTDRFGIIFIVVWIVFEDFGDYETYIDLHVVTVPFFIFSIQVQVPS